MGDAQRRGDWRRRRKRLVRRLRAYPEGWLVSLAAAVIPRLPRRAVPALARVAGGVMAAVARRERAIVEANLDLVYGPAADPGARARRVRAIFRHSALVLLDCFWFSRDSRERVLRYVSCDDTLNAVLRDPRPAVVVAAHLGSWELGAQVACVRGREVTSVYAPVGGGVTQQRLAAMRAANGQTIVPREGALRGLLKAMRERQFAGLMLDQYTAVEEGGAFVDFLGRKAAISQVAGVLSLRFRTPVHVLRCHHQGEGRYRAEITRSLPPGHGMNALQVTQWVATALGDAILGVPDQWLWMYRRWRHVPPGEDIRDYPFYARPRGSAAVTDRKPAGGETADEDV